MSGRLAEPVRTCIGCRERADRGTLLRVVMVDGVLTPDPHHSLPGRGAHLHPDERCWQQAVRRRAFGRALRVEGPVDLSRLEALVRTWPTTSTTNTDQRPKAEPRS